MKTFIVFAILVAAVAAFPAEDIQPVNQPTEDLTPEQARDKRNLYLVDDGLGIASSYAYKPLTFALSTPIKYAYAPVYKSPVYRTYSYPAWGRHPW